MKNQNVAQRIAKAISLELNLSSEREEVIAYGIFGLLQIIFSIIIIIVVGFFLGVTKEALIISIIMSIVRKSSGGVHATSPLRCTIIGTVMCVGVAFLVKSNLISLKISIIINLVSIIVVYYLIYKLAPVDTPNKPIKREDKKRRLKKISLITITFFYILIIVFIGMYEWHRDSIFIIYSNCICLGMLLQVVTLTKIGHQLFNNIDVFLSKFVN